MITSLIYSLVKLLLGVLAIVFGLIVGLALLGVALPTGIYYQLGRFFSFLFKKRNTLPFIVMIVLFTSCKPEPEFYMAGKPFYTRSRCIESHTETSFGYRYGMGFNGKMSYSYGPTTEVICDVKVIDTIEINQ